MSALNKCPHPHCESLKPRNQYACRPHWFSLPKKIRDKGWEGYRKSASLWATAHDEALAYWKGKEK